MQVGNISIATFLQLIRGKILQLPVKNFVRDLLLEDIDNAISCFNQGNTQCVINSLLVITAKVEARIANNPCSSKIFSPLLSDINQLQQILIELPVNIGPSGPPGPPGPQGPTGPQGPQGPPGPSCPETENMLVNGDFEDSTTSLAPWIPVNATTKTFPNSQLFSGAVVADIGTDGSISQTVTGISPGCPYLLSFALQANPAQPGMVTVTFITATGTVTGTFSRELFTLGSGYYTYVYLLTAPPNTASAIITFSKDGGGSDVFVDNVNFGSP